MARRKRRKIKDILPDVRELFENPELAIPLLEIVDKNGKYVNFEPRPEQLQIVKDLLQDGDLVIGKPRQVGISTVIAAWLFCIWISARDPIKIGILSRDWTSTLHIFGMWLTFYDSLPAGIRPELSKKTSTTMTVAYTGASVRAVSAKPGALRSHTYTYLHLSELAFTENSDEVLSTAYSVLSGNKLIVESTANHYNDAVMQLIEKAQRGEANLNYTFLPWSLHEDYRIPCEEGFEKTADEIEYAEVHGLDDEQINWRRKGIEKHGFAKFQREYPLTIEEAYAQAGSSYFAAEDLQYVVPVHIQFPPDKIVYVTPPDPNDSYAIGCDVAAGRGRDYSTILCLSKQTMQPVALYRSNTTSTDKFAEKIQEVAVRYNRALVLVEENNWGLPVLQSLRKILGYTRLWSHPKTGKDWNTNTKSRMQLFEQGQRTLRSGIVRDIDMITMSELRSFILDASESAPHVPKNLPHHGDMVIALLLAIECIKRVQIKTDSMPTWFRDRQVQNTLNQGIGLGRRY